MSEAKLNLDFKKVIKLFANENKMANDDIEKIKSKIRTITIKKGEIFLRQGSICNKLGILLNGLLSAYYETDEKIISRFFYNPKNPIVTSFDSFKHQRESNETIEALEDSYLFYFNYEDLQFLYQEVPIMNQIGREIAEDSYIKALERIHQLQSYNAKQRFEKFYNENNFLFNRLSKKDIGSYLKMNRNLVSQYMKEVNNAT